MAKHRTMEGLSMCRIEGGFPLPLPLFNLMPQLSCVRNILLPLSILNPPQMGDEDHPQSSLKHAHHEGMILQMLCPCQE